MSFQLDFKVSGCLTFGSAGAILPSHHYHFYTQNRLQMPVLAIVSDPLTHPYFSQISMSRGESGPY